MPAPQRRVSIALAGSSTGRTTTAAQSRLSEHEGALRKPTYANTLRCNGGLSTHNTRSTVLHAEHDPLPLFRTSTPSLQVARRSILAFTLAGCSTPTPVGPVDTRATGDTHTESDAETGRLPGQRRTPAEWELQAAVWLQWPQAWEAHFRPAFVDIVRVTSQHQDVHLLAHDEGLRDSGAQRLAQAGVDDSRITWHVIKNDNAWMRDNGPRYVEVDGELIVQDWGFDAWGGNFGASIPWAFDDAVPTQVAEILGLQVESIDMVHERGDLEFNGTDTVIVSWSVISDRNPQISREQSTQLLQAAFGVESVVYLEGYHAEDGTTGHVDGLARFISASEVVVGQIENPSSDPLSASLFDDVAAQISAQRPDLSVYRMPFPAGTDYMNWLVGNGYVVSGAFGNATADQAAKARIESYFPGRTVYFVDVQDMWADGGGVHCVTNDQPRPP